MALTEPGRYATKMHVDALPEAERELVLAATAARERARAPYSRFRVGAAARGASGRVHPGFNVESAAYPQCCCAERVALYAALANGEDEVVALAVITDGGAAPCGGCRQVLFEYLPDAPLLIAGTDGQVARTTARALLPGGFDGAALR